MFFFFFFFCFFSNDRGTLTSVVHNVGVAVVLMSDVVNKRPLNNCLNIYILGILGMLVL